jgi:predicted AlkP superfamily phosphohydrolase/phosphomutase
MNDKKVIVIGIDGGTFDVIRPMIEQGELPHIASLMKAGVCSDLQSTIPPITAPAWTSFMTGTNPGKHGIFGFVGDMHKKYDGRILSAADSKSKTLWSILSECQRRLTLLNIPFTYPPSPINGIMISGMGAPTESFDVAYPKDIYKELLQEVENYKIDHHIDDIFNDETRVEARADELISILHDMEIKRTDAALYLLKKYDCDMFMIVYTMTDRLQHHFWKFMDTTHPEYDPKLARLYGQTIQEGYRKVDTEIGRILRKVGDHVTVIVMSDHGFGPLYKCFYINSWLIQKGLMKLKRTFPWRLKFAHTPVHRALKKLRLGMLSSLLSKNILNFNLPRLKMIPKKWVDLVDWSRTKVYAADPLGVSVNLKGREPEGIINPGEDFEGLLKNVGEELSKLRDPETEELVMDEVIRNNRAYTGPCVNEAPDILISLKGLSYLPFPFRLKSKQLFEPPPNRWSGTHRFNGILIMKGPEISPSVPLLNPRIIDVAPTILYLFNQPVPRDMDGRVIEEAFSPDHLKTNPVTYDNRDVQESKSEEALSGGDEEKVRKHLESLGYL